MRSKRRYWIVRHNLEALTAMPSCIWRTSKRKEPRTFKQVARGDHWVSYAYTTSGARERSLRMVTGFYECVRQSRYDLLPQRVQKIFPGVKRAWIIKGSEFEWQPQTPVGVPSIPDMLGRKVWNQTALTEISKSEFESIRKQVRRRELKPTKIPLLRREPRYEQEVVAIVACGHEQLGIEKILRIRNAFPDMTVKLRGRSEPVHLELEVYSSSFIAHKHARDLDWKGSFTEDLNGHKDTKPVGLLCWVDDSQRSKLKREGRVQHVFELQSLIREGKGIRWSRGVSPSL